MNFKTTLVLLVVVVFGAVVWLAAPRREPGSTARREASPETRYVLDARPEENDVVRVEVERPGRPRLVFERPAPVGGQVGEWRLVEPVAGPAENYMVNAIVGTYARLESSSSASPGELSPADAGLAPPTAKVLLHDKDGKTYAIEVGRRPALSNDTFVRVAGQERIHVVKRELARDLDKEVKDYRSKALVKLNAADIMRVQVLHAGRTYEFARTVGEPWTIVAPIRAPADADRMRGYVSRIAALYVAGFAEENPGSLSGFGLDEPFVQVTATAEHRKPAPPGESGESPSEPEIETTTVTVLVGAHADMQQSNRFIKLADQPWVATISSPLVDGFVPKLDELRDARVTRLTEAEVVGLELTRGEERAVVERRDGAWHGEGDLSEVESEAVRDVVSALVDLRAVQFIDEPGPPADYGLDAPRAVVSVRTATAERALTVRVGRDTPSGQNAYVQVDGQSGVVAVKAAQAQRLAVAPLALRSRVVFDYDPGDLRGIDVHHGERRYTLARSEGAWTLADPPDAPVDPTSAREIATDLARLRAKRVVARGDDERYGLRPPAATIRFSVERMLPGPDAPEEAAEQAAVLPREVVEHTLLVGRKGEAAYARKDDSPFIFELDETVYRVLTNELIHRQLLDLDPERIVGVRIEATGGTVEFVRDGADWTFPADPSVQLAQSKVKELVGDLARLRVDSYVAYRDGDVAGFENAPATVALRLRDGSAVTLRLEQVKRGELPRLAAWVEERRVFMLRAGDADKLMRGLDQYLAPEKPSAAPGAQPPASALPPGGGPG